MPRRQKKRDPLDEPIVRPDPLTVELVSRSYRHSPSAQAAIHRRAVEVVVGQKLAKLQLLAERHGVHLGAPGAWPELCLRLAEHYVKGFKVLDQYAYSEMPEMEVLPRGPGAPPQDQFDLVKAIEARVGDGRESVTEACDQLSRAKGGPWKGRNPHSLESRYYEWRRQRKHKTADPLVEVLQKAADQAISAGDNQS